MREYSLTGHFGVLRMDLSEKVAARKPKEGFTYKEPSQLKNPNHPKFPANPFLREDSNRKKDEGM